MAIFIFIVIVLLIVAAKVLHLLLRGRLTIRDTFRGPDGTWLTIGKRIGRRR